MTKIWQKLTALTTGALLSLLAIEANPVQAAVFNFFSEGPGRLIGELSFNDATSGLTGIGTEEVSLSQLNGNFGLLFETNSTLPFVGTLSWNNSDILSSPVFTFESGSLVGVNLALAPKAPTWGNPGPGGGLWVETNQVSFQDATYTIKQSIVIKGSRNPFCPPFILVPEPPYSIPNPDCVPRDVPGPTYVKTGNINFVTQVPFKRSTSVPEPASVVSLSLLSLALILNKKTASSQG